MKIVYNEGPPNIEMGAAGRFKRGEPKEVDDALAPALLRKTTVRFTEVLDPATAPPEETTAKAPKKKE